MYIGGQCLLGKIIEDLKLIKCIFYLVQIDLEHSLEFGQKVKILIHTPFMLVKTLSYIWQ